MPRTNKQNEKIKDRRKSQILKAALALFCEKGYDNVSIDDVCKKCRISHGLFYHYFDTKEAIKNEFYEEGKEKRDEADSMLNNPHLRGYEFIEKSVQMLLQIIKTEPAACFFVYWEFSELLTSINSYKDLKNKLSDHPVLKKTLKEIKEGQKRREVTPGVPEEILLTYISCIVGISFMKMRNKSNVDLIPNDDVIMNIFTRKKGF